MIRAYAEGNAGKGRPGETMGEFIRRTGGSNVGATKKTRGKFAPVSSQAQRGQYAGQPNRRVRG